jgi:hypothetical protein
MRSSYGSTNGNGESPTATTSTYSEMGNAAVPVPVPDVVPVAAAPKDNNLYDALLRYHTENDDSDDAESEDWRRRNQRDSPRNKNTSAEYEYEDYAVAVAGAAGKDDADADADHSRKKKSPPQDTTEDRKLPARSTNHYLKQAPPKSKSAPVPATFQKAPPSLAAPTTGDLLKSLSPPSSPVSPRTRGAASSFYQAALAESWMREESPHNNHNHNHTIPSSHSPKKVLSKPGIVHVNEPAIRPDSAMYRAAYGGGPSSQSQSHPIHQTQPQLPTLQASRAESIRELQLRGLDDNDYVYDNDEQRNKNKPLAVPSRGPSRPPTNTNTDTPPSRGDLHRPPGFIDQQTQTQTSHAPHQRNRRGVGARPGAGAPPARTRSIDVLGGSSNQARSMDAFGGRGSSNQARRPVRHRSGSFLGGSHLGGRPIRNRSSGDGLVALDGNGNGNGSNRDPPATRDRSAANNGSNHGPLPLGRVTSGGGIPMPMPLDPGSDEHIRHAYKGPKKERHAYTGNNNHHNNNTKHQRPTTVNSPVRPRGVSPMRNLAAAVFGRNPNPQPSPRNLPPEYNMMMHSGAPYNANLPSSVPPPRARPKSPRGFDGLLPSSHKPTSNPNPSRSSSNPEVMPERIVPLKIQHRSSTGHRPDDSSDMDEDLRLALEISKQDTGGVGSNTPVTHPPNNNNNKLQDNRDTSSVKDVFAATPSHQPLPRAMPSRQPLPRHQQQTSFGRAAESQNSSLADIMLALKLSAEENESNNPDINTTNALAIDRRKSTSLEELLVLERAQSSDQNMTDFVAAGISTHEPKASMPPNENNEQLRILEQIREEQEQKELELALKASEQEQELYAKETLVQAGQGGGHGQAAQTRDFLLSQQKAMEEWSGNQDLVATTRGGGAPGPERQSSVSSIDSVGRRKELLERGTQETQQAISSGQSRIVTCRGCAGRLQAPVSYSLVFCPKCQTISPA